MPPKGAAAVFYGIWPALVVAGAIHSCAGGTDDGCVTAADWSVALAIVLRSRRCGAADIKVDLSKETVGKPPATFEPMVGTWVVAQDGADKVIMVDGRPWVASKDNPTKLLIESARKLYGTSQRRADGQREAVRLLPGRGAARASTTSRTARSA